MVKTFEIIQDTLVQIFLCLHLLNHFICSADQYKIGKNLDSFLTFSKSTLLVALEFNT